MSLRSRLDRLEGSALPARGPGLDWRTPVAGYPPEVLALAARELAEWEAAREPEWAARRAAAEAVRIGMGDPPADPSWNSSPRPEEARR